VVVAKEFAHILDGVSYVKPDVWDGPYDKLADAVKYAKDRYDSVVVGTVWWGVVWCGVVWRLQRTRTGRDGRGKVGRADRVRVNVAAIK
jgi:hypothetical protein